MSTIKIEYDGVHIKPVVVDWDKIRFKKDMEWVFNFKGGGWNSVFAKTKKSAIKIAKERYPKHSKLEPNENTFKVPTKEEHDNLLSMFW